MVESKKDILLRVYIIFFAFCLFGSAIILQIVRLQFVQGDFWRSKADSLMLDYKTIEANRGSIYACDGSFLAASLPVYEARIDFAVKGIKEKSFNNKVDSLALCLSQLFNDRTKNEYRQLLCTGRNEGEKYFLLKRNISHKQVKQVKQFPVFREGRYKGGLIVIQKSKREKPFQMLAHRTIGYKRQGVEPVGIEGAYDKYLTGTSGQRLMQKLSGGVWKPVNDENEIEPRDGNDVISTIDPDIQDVAHRALLTQLQMHGADKGCAILMEVATGEIKAIANLTRDKNGEYWEDFNYAIGYATDPGSTFKLASYMTAIEHGHIKIDDTVDTQGGVYTVGGLPVKDSHDGGYGKISVKQAFEVSSNVAVAKLIRRHYAKNPHAFINALHHYHLDRPIGLQIRGEAKPKIKNPGDKDWSKVSLAFMSFGYESLLTPLQILTFYNGVANNGKMVKPLFVKEIRNKGHVIKKYNTEVLVESLCSPSTIARLKLMMEGVVENGTATNLSTTEYKIAGKTGTAQLNTPGKGYKSGKMTYQASFVGYFPAEEPKYSCMVAVFAPSNNVYYGNRVAGPIFREIADKVYSIQPEMHKELQPDTSISALRHPLVKKGDTRKTISAIKTLKLAHSTSAVETDYVCISTDGSEIRLKEINMQQGLVPDVTGMGLRDALNLLESRGMKTSVTGRGTVKRQSVAAGTRAVKGQSIVIELG